MYAIRNEKKTVAESIRNTSHRGSEWFLKTLIILPLNVSIMSNCRSTKIVKLKRQKSDMNQFLGLIKQIGCNKAYCAFFTFPFHLLSFILFFIMLSHRQSHN